MKFLLPIIVAAGCYAQSISFSSTDTRCVNGGGTTSCTFLQQEAGYPDYGVAIDAVVSGTWTINLPATQCNAQDAHPQALVALIDGSQPSTISASQTLHITNFDLIYAGWYMSFKCAPGTTYTYTVDFVNGGTTVSISFSQIVKLRQAAPIFINAAHSLDEAISGSLVPLLQPTGWTYDVNQIPCSPACNPFTSYTPPLNAGDTLTTETGSVLTAISPFGDFNTTTGSGGKSELNADDTLAILQNRFGALFVWDVAGASGNSPLYTLSNTDYSSNDSGCWASTPGNEMVFWVVVNVAFKSSTTFRKLTFGSPPSFTNSGTFYTLPAATYGRFPGGAFGHQDCTRDDWVSLATLKDYQTVVNISGTTVTRVSGDTFDASLVGQNLENSSQAYLSADVVSVNTGAQTLVLTQAPTGGNCTGCTITFEVPFMQGGLDLPQALALGAAYVPVATSIIGAFPVAITHNLSGNGGSWIAPSVDPSDGKYYNFSGNSNGPPLLKWNGSFTPGVSTAMSLTYGPTVIPDSYAKLCDNTATWNLLPNIGNRCINGHDAPFSRSDGTPWWSTFDSSGGQFYTIYKMKDAGIDPRPVVGPSYDGNTAIPFYPAGGGGEFNSCRGTPTKVCPFWTVSTSQNPNSVTNWVGSSCTATNPTVCTLDASGPFMSGTSILVGHAFGCQNLWGKHTATTVVGTIATIAADCSGGAPSGDIFIALATAVDLSASDIDQALVFRDIGNASTAFRVGHFRTPQYNNAGFETFFYSIPRCGIGISGRKMLCTSNFGIPGNIQTVVVDLPYCAGMAAKDFDCSGHTVTSSVSPTGATLSYTAPNTGTAIIEIGKTQRWTDGLVSADQSGACGTGSRSVLSLASGNVYTCGITSLTWSAGAADATYQKTIDTSGNAAHSNSFTGLTTGDTYYYRILVDNYWSATGSFIPSGSTPITSGINTTGAVIFRGGILPTR